MNNFEVSRILRNIPILLIWSLFLLSQEPTRKPRFRLRDCKKNWRTDRKSGLQGLCELPGVGSSIAEKIEELIKTGKLQYYEELKQKAPVDFESLSGIEGIGPKKIKALFEKLQIKNVDDLEKAALEHMISNCHILSKKLKKIFLSQSSLPRKIRADLSSVLRFLLFKA